MTAGAERGAAPWGRSRPLGWGPVAFVTDRANPFGKFFGFQISLPLASLLIVSNPARRLWKFCRRHLDAHGGRAASRALGVEPRKPSRGSFNVLTEMARGWHLDLDSVLCRKVSFHLSAPLGDSE